MYNWCARLTSLTLICWRVNEQEEYQINVASLQVTDCWLFLQKLFQVQQWQVHECKLLGHARLLQIRSGLISVVNSKEKCWSPNSCLFRFLNVILPWSLATAVEEKKKSSFFVCPLLPFVFWMTFLGGTKHSENKRNQTKWTLHKNCAFSKDDIVEYYMFSVSLTGIVKSLLFKRWIKACINKLLVCFFIHNFVIWCIFLFFVSQ